MERSLTTGHQSVIAERGRVHGPGGALQCAGCWAGKGGGDAPDSANSDKDVVEADEVAVGARDGGRLLGGEGAVRL